MLAERAWRSLKGAELLRDVYNGKKFVDGKVVKKAEHAAHAVLRQL
jgi:hypothetical protein